MLVAVREQGKRLLGVIWGCIFSSPLYLYLIVSAPSIPFTSCNTTHATTANFFMSAYDGVTVIGWRRFEKSIEGYWREAQVLLSNEIQH